MRFSPVFDLLDRSRCIARSTVLGVTLSLFEGFTIQNLEIYFIKETRD